MLLKISHKNNSFHLLASINLVFIHIALPGFTAQQGKQRESIANTGRPHHEQQGCRQQVKGEGHSPLFGICGSSFGYQRMGKVSAESHCDSQGQLHLPCEEMLRFSLEKSRLWGSCREVIKKREPDSSQGGTEKDLGAMKNKLLARKF